VAVVSREIIAFWDLRALANLEPAFGRSSEDVARSAMLSGWWALAAAAALTAGLRRAYAPLRYFAIALFGLTVAKTVLIDMARLGGISRIAAFFVVGAVLLFASFLYQRRRADPSS
jgi:uncharacterized membrane protein